MSTAVSPAPARSIPDRLLAGETIHFDRTLPPEDRTVEASWIAAAVASPVPVNVLGAVIHGPLSFKYSVFSKEFSLKQCEVSETADFSCATFHAALILDETKFHQAVSFQNAQFQFEVQTCGVHYSNPAAPQPADFSGIRAAGAFDASGSHFHGKVTFELARFTSNGLFRNSSFAGEARFRLAQFAGQAVFEGAVFKGEANFQNARLDSGLFLKANQEHKAPGAIFHQVANFRHVGITAAAECDGVQFEAKADFDSAHIGGHAFFRSATFREEAIFRGATIHQTAEFQGAVFAGKVSFNSAHVEGALFCRAEPLNSWKAVEFHGEVDFINAGLGSAEFQEAVFSQTATFRRLEVEGLASFIGAHFHQKVEFEGCNFGDRAEFQGVEFHADACFATANFKAPALFSIDKGKVHATFHGRADFKHVSFCGIADFDLVSFLGTEGGADFDRAQFSSSAYFRGAEFTGPAVFRSISVLGQAGFQGAQFHGSASFNGAKVQTGLLFNAQAERHLPRATFAGDVNFRYLKALGAAQLEASFAGLVDFREATFRTLELLDPVTNTAANFAHSIDLRGCTYDRIQVSPEVLLKLPNGRPRLEYDRQPYTQLEKVLQSMGRDDEANDVHLEQRRVERLRMKRYGPSWCLDSLYKYGANYGIRPIRLAVFAFLWLALGCGIFFLNGSHQPSTPKKGTTKGTTASGQQEAELPGQSKDNKKEAPEVPWSLWTDPVRLSIRTFLPVEVPLATEWEPSDASLIPHVLRFSDFATLEHLAGWVLVPVGVAALAGLLRRSGGSSGQAE